MTEGRATYATAEERLREESRSPSDRKLDEVLALTKRLVVAVGDIKADIAEITAKVGVGAEVVRTCNNCADWDKPCLCDDYSNWRPRTTEAQP